MPFHAFLYLSTCLTPTHSLSLRQGGHFSPKVFTELISHLDWIAICLNLDSLEADPEQKIHMNVLRWKHQQGRGEVEPVKETKLTRKYVLSHKIQPRVTLAHSHRRALKRVSCLKVVLIGVREKKQLYFASFGYC